MIRISRLTTIKMLSKLNLSTKNVAKENFDIIKVPKDRYEDYIEFMMEHYVKNEISHQISGIPKCEEAMMEYRQILWNNLNEPNVENYMCYLDSMNDHPIVGITSTKLVTVDNLELHVGEIKTEPVKRFYDILNKWNNMYPLPELMTRLGVDRYFDDCGMATHPDFRCFGIATKMGLERLKICRKHNVRVTGAWVTAVGTQLAAARGGWQTVFEISYTELGKRLNLDFKNIKHTCKYMICYAY